MSTATGASCEIDDNSGCYIEQSGLPFRAREFRKTDLNTRKAVYQQLADPIWNPALLCAEAAS